MPTKTAIILNPVGVGHHHPSQMGATAVDHQHGSTAATIMTSPAAAAAAATLQFIPPVVFNPSHTLAPLVAAAIAATPVTTRQPDTSGTITQSVATGQGSVITTSTATTS